MKLAATSSLTLASRVGDPRCGIRMARASLSRGAVALAVGLAVAGLAQAETSPYYIGVSQAFNHDSNLFRVPDNQSKVSDTTSSTGLVAGIDQPLGRQRLRADGRVSANRFQDRDQLNYTGYGLNAALDWQTIERLSGVLGYSANQTLADYAAPGAPVVTATENTQRSEQAFATIRWGLTPSIALEAGAQQRRITYSAVEQQAQNTKQKTGNVGVRWGSGGPLSLGLGVRKTTGGSPNFLLPTADEIDRRDVDLTASWVPSGLSTINARISSTREDHLAPSQPDFSGATGAINWIYKPTGRTSFNTMLSRDTGFETRFLDFGGLVGPQAIATDRLINSAMVTIGYELTAKIQLTGKLRRDRGSFTDALGNSGSDTTTLMSLAARYEPTRSVALGCNIGRERRNGGSAVAAGYTSNVAGCSVTVSFRP